MADETMSPADLMAIMNNSNGNGNNMWSNPFMYLIWLAIFSNGGFFGNNNGALSAAALNAGTVGRAELADGLNNQTVLNDLRSIETGIKDSQSTTQSVGAGLSQQMCSSFGNTNMNILNGLNNLNTNVLSNANGIVNAINNAASNQQIANCNLSHAIQDNKYEMAQNTCVITDAVHKEGELTRKSILDQQIQNLRDSREEVQRDLQSAQITLANANQTQNILNSLGRYVAYSGCGSNCGCNSGF